MLAAIENPLFIAFLIVGMIVWIVWIFTLDARAISILREWAQSNGWKLASYETRVLVRGPFWWRTSKAQYVYRIDVVEADGNHRTGYARVGGWFFGLLEGKVTVEWDKPWAVYGPMGFPVLPANAKDKKDETSST